jgi:predicted dehydrogenase
MCSFQSNARAFPYYLNKNHPHRVKDETPHFFKNGDTCSSSIQTDKGVLIDCRVDWSSVRPHDMVRYELQGTKGSFLLHNEQPLIWLEGYSQQTPTGVAGHEWDPLEKFAREFEHPLWVQHAGEAKQAGHGGGDYFTLKEFADSIHEGRAPEVDVYDAVAWSAVYPLSSMSIDSGNQPVEFPGIARGKARS